MPLSAPGKSFLIYQVLLQSLSLSQWGFLKATALSAVLLLANIKIRQTPAMFHRQQLFRIHHKHAKTLPNFTGLSRS